MTDRFREIILVYNADCSLPGAAKYVADMLRGSDSCALCEISHHAIAEKSGWEACKASVEVPVRALYRNQLIAQLAVVAGDSFPCVIVAVNERYERLLERTDLERCPCDPQALPNATKAATSTRNPVLG